MSLTLKYVNSKPESFRKYQEVSYVLQILTEHILVPDVNVLVLNQKAWM